LMHGNRDFLLGQAFAVQTGCQLLTDPSVISLYGEPTLLMHGDTLCTEDKGYLRYRYCVRNFICQRLFLGLPLKWRQAIAERLRKASQRHTTSVARRIMDVVENEVIDKMTCYQVTQLIHGHTHRPMLRYFSLPNGNLGRHIVLGDWDACGSVLIYQAGGELRLESLSGL
jgi:UDP-2,3-diacylglucosamine hydrolase